MSEEEGMVRAEFDGIGEGCCYQFYIIETCLCLSMLEIS